MSLLHAPMSHARILIWLAAFCGAFSLVVDSRAQSGPAVQLFTSTADGSTRILPLERLPMAVTVSVNAGYDTNVSNTASGEGDSLFSSVSLALGYSFGTERTRATLSWSASVTYYSNDEADNFSFDPSSAFNLGLSHEVNERFSLSAGIYAYYGIEPDFVHNVSEDRRSGSYFSTNDSLSGTFQWLERLSTVTSYSIGLLAYDDPELGDSLNHLDHGLSQQFRFLFLPMTTITAGYQASLTTYQTGVRGSISHFFSVGISQTIGPHLQGSFQGGLQYRSSDAEDGSTFSPFGSANLTYILGEKTSANWSAQYSTEDSNIVEATSRESFSTGLSLNYSLTARISTSVSAYYRHDSYLAQPVIAFQPGVGFFIFRPTLSEESFDLGLNLSYAITPRLSANAAIGYTNVTSEFTERPYSRARYSGGVSYSF